MPDRGFGLHSSNVDPEEVRKLRAKAERRRTDWTAWYRLGLLLQSDLRPAEASEALSRALELARTQRDRLPNSPEAAERFAQSQLALGDGAAAATSFRTIARRWPKRWGARIGLARALNTVGTEESRAESDTVLDEAVADFPRRPEICASRAGMRFYRNRQSEALNDYLRAGELAGDDPYALALSPWMEEAASAMRTGKGMALDTSWADLAPDVRARVSKTMGRLRRLSGSADDTLAAKSLTALGFLRYELQHDVQCALDDLYAALRRDPGRVDSREMILHIYGVEERWSDLATFSQSCARETGKVRFRLAAAFASARLWLYDDAAAQLDAALRSEPNDLAFVLARAAVAIQDPSGKEDALAASLLKRAEIVSREQPSFRANVAYLRGMERAIAGDYESARAALAGALGSAQASRARRALALLEAN